MIVESAFLRADSTREERVQPSSMLGASQQPFSRPPDHPPSAISNPFKAGGSQPFLFQPTALLAAGGWLPPPTPGWLLKKTSISRRSFLTGDIPLLQIFRCYFGLLFCVFYIVCFYFFIFVLFSLRIHFLPKTLCRRASLPLDRRLTVPSTSQCRWNRLSYQK